MITVGSIKKISVKNFITHSRAVVTPGPHLNMIIGPNGSGKSTIVAAIILGLGGNPKIIGRSTNLAEFVKHNCNEAKIDIELQDHNDEILKITRIFTLQSRNTWKINDKIVTHKDIEEIIAKYNIQVDNLCQFLPQDRVQDFAKMNKQQLLENTQIAVCRADLAEKQKMLITLRSEHKELEEKLHKYKKKLAEDEAENKTLESRIENVEQKKLLMNKVDIFERKIAWLQYNAIKDELNVVKEDEKSAREILHRHKIEVNPIETAITNAAKLISLNQNRITEKGFEIRKENKNRDDLLNKLETFKQEIRDTKHDIKTKLDIINQHQRDVNFITSKIEQLENDKASTVNEYGHVDSILQQTNKLMEDLAIIKRSKHNLEDKKEEFNQLKCNNTFKLRQYEQELMKFEDVKQQRLAHLRKLDAETYKAVLWLRENKHIFKGNIFEPIMLEINAKNVSHAKFIENIISVRDRIAFTCELKEDMNMLLRSLRLQQLNVNVVHSGKEHTSLINFLPTIPLEQLKTFGIFSYVRDLIHGPEPIMKYLCRTYSLHNIPVGTAVTNKYIENMPKEIVLFFSDSHRFSVKVSHYTGEKMTTSNEIHTNGSFSVVMDTEKINYLQNEIKEKKTTNCNLAAKIEAINKEITNIDVSVNNCTDKIKNFRNQRLQLCEVEERIKSSKNQLKILNEMNLNKNVVMETAQTQINGIIEKAINCHKTLGSTLQKFQQLTIECDLMTITLETCRKQLTILKNKANIVRRQSEDAQRTLDSIKERLIATHQRAKKALADAKSLSKGLTPNDDSFRLELEKLSDDIDELKEQRDELQSRADCIRTADQDEVNAFENRELHMKDLQKKINHLQIKFDDVSQKLMQLHEEWITELNNLICKINNKFCESFARMDCSGEVCLYKGENELDFDNYGLSIKVKFRDEEPLQELNRYIQSGGERAVSTAIFMLSLQEITPVPFRCVDEINQGMDPINERRIFNFLIETMEVENTPQYFLVTPKLIPKLNYGEKCMVHYVHNGPFVCSQKKWFTSNESFSARHSLTKVS